MKLGNTSIQFKIICLVLIAALLPLLIFYFLGIQNFLADMKETLARELSTKAVLAAKDLDRFIEQRIIDTKTISRSPVLSSSSNQEITKYLKEVANENPWINEIDLLSDQGLLLAHSSNEEIEHEPAWEAYPQLKNLFITGRTENLNDVYITETKELDNGQGAGVLFLTKVRGQNESWRSKIILVELAFNDINSIVVNFREVFESDKHVYIVKNDGTVMFTDDNTVQPFQTFPDINQHPDMLSFFSEPGAKGHFHYKSKTGEPVTAAYADMSEFGVNSSLDWSIITLASESRFFSSLNTSKQNLLITGILLSLCMGTVAYILSTRITRPLLKTVTAVRAFGKGDFSTQVPVEGSHETKLLAEAFNSMAQQLSNRRKELENEISERKMIEKELLESNSVKNEFIATASHELRTPLSVVTGYAELLLNNDQFSAKEQKEFLQYIHDKSFSLDRIVDELLDVSRIESGRALSIEPTKVNISNIAEQVVSQFQKERPQHNFHMSFTDGDDLEIRADEGKLFQVFENLVGNAVKFSTEDAQISIVGEKQNNHYMVSVKDNGMGISPEHQKCVFDKFFRADTSDTSTHGLGIGLYLTKNIIELHKGKIWVESRLGEGCSFHFTLPAQPIDLKNS